MNLRVLWTPVAEGRLAEAWIASPDRNAVAAAAAEIDRQLATRGDTFGESREAGIRVCFVAPLGVEFEVMLETQTILVLSVWTYRPRPPQRLHEGNGRK